MTKKLKFLFFLLLLPLLAFAEYEQGDTSFFIMKHREKEGVGYNEGYTTLSFWLSPCWKEIYEPFIDARLHIFNDGKVASNIGVGCRFPLLQDAWAFGWNFYYDFRNSSCHSFNQLSLGLEALSEIVDLRLNGYFPVGGSAKTKDEFLCFDNRGFLTTQVITFSLPSLYIEAGGYIPKCEVINLYGAIGPYYLFEQECKGVSSGNSLGAKARLSALVYDGIQLGVDATYDTLFNARVQGYISLALPFGPANMRTRGKRWKEWYPDEASTTRALLRRRLTQVVTRNEIIPTTSRCVPCISPFPMLFVDNQAGDGGDGTMESPFNSLKQAEINSCKGDVIYVFYGDGTSRNYDTGFCLKEEQILAGSGLGLKVNDVNLPPLTPGKFPTITNAGDVIRLSSHSTVKGFHILPCCDQNAIIGCDVEEIKILCNRVNGGRKGIVLCSVEERNQIKSNQISNVKEEAIFVENSSGVEIINNCLDHACSHGMFLSEVTNTEIKENKIEENGGCGIVLVAKSGEHIINKNKFRENALAGLQISNSNNANFSLFGNCIDHQGSNAALLGVIGGSKIELLINNNEIRTGTKGVDLTFNSQENAEFTLDMNNNEIFSNTNPSIFVNQIGAKLNALISSGTGNRCDADITFMTNAQHHAICLYNWSNNKAHAFTFDNAGTGLFNVNAPMASQNGFTLSNNHTPVILIGNVQFQPEQTSCQTGQTK